MRFGIICWKLICDLNEDFIYIDVTLLFRMGLQLE